VARSVAPGSLLARDIPSSIVVFLVALPLCLGIALASNAPLFSGIIAGVIGGLVIGLLGGSQVSVSGPAAGLTTIVAAAIGTISGDFQLFLAALVLAGVLQFLLSLVKAGTLVDYVPNSVVRGMLTAIGIVILLKQIPHLLGRDIDPEGELAFLQRDGLNTFEEIWVAINTATPVAVSIGLVSLLVLIVWENKPVKGTTFSKYIPGPLVVVMFGILANELVKQFLPGTELSALDKHLVELPVATDRASFLGLFTTPDFSAYNLAQTYRVAITIALVASLETLLSLEAADKLDPQRRNSNKNKELRAQGIGNTLSGLIGGLPITAVIVRTSANVYAGATTRRSAVFHGLLLLLSALLIPGLLNRIPLACLAAILIMVGYKLCSPKIFKAQYRQGLAQFLPFLITIVAIVFTDLLIGVLIGIVVGFYFAMRTLHSNAFTLVSHNGNYLLRINNDLTFIHKNEMKQKLSSVPNDAKLLIDGIRAAKIDIDVYQELLEYLQQASFRNITVELKNLRRQAPAHIKALLPQPDTTLTA
jgi:MFS superfamily sulfate permease-like transporter